MSIRNAAKAIVLHDNRILLNKCHGHTIGEYYALPGGGQNQYETMEAAIVRECLEETGYTVIPQTFVALYEEIHSSETLRERDPDYAHKIYHVFKCSLADQPRVLPTEQDAGQDDCVWVDIDDIPSINLLPRPVRDHLQHLIQSGSPLYLGSDFLG